VAIDVVNRQRLARVDARRVAILAEATLDTVGRAGAAVTVAFVRDRVIRDLNCRYRDTDSSTDVLSFRVEAGRAGTGDTVFNGSGVQDYLGDIVISTDTALRQANEAARSFERELDELVIHGVLHLCGYDHESDRGQMNRLELKLRKKLLGE
jgi:probable rRNA maturation factor